MNPTHTAVSPAALSRVLDALENGSSVPLRSLADRTGLSVTTVTRAIQKAARAGILAFDEGADPASGRPCHLVTPAASAVLPVLMMNQGYGAVRVTDLALTPLGTAVTELNSAIAPEESLRLLCCRGMTLLRGCAHSTGLSVTAPVLVTDSPTAPHGALTEAVSGAMGVPPLAVLTYGEAVARGISVMELPRDASSLLFLRVGEGLHACILLRDGENRWRVSPLGMPLSSALSRYLAPSARAENTLRRGAAAFVFDLCRFLSPDLVVWEDPRQDTLSAEVLRTILPEGIRVARYISPAEGLSAAEYGAALTGRRILWDKILESEQV